MLSNQENIWTEKPFNTRLLATLLATLAKSPTPGSEPKLQGLRQTELIVCYDELTVIRFHNDFVV